MAMVCTICNHPKRIDLDRLLVQGQSYQKIANEFGVDAQALRRHKEGHLSRQLTQAYERKGLAESMDLLGHIDKIIARAEKIFSRNYEKNTYLGDDVALKALTQQRSTIELLAKISAYLHEARLLELQNNQQHFESEAKVEYQQKLKLLTTPELKVYLYLVQKMNGEEVPENMISEIVKTPQPIPRPPEPAAAPRSEAAPINDTPEPEPEIEPVPKRLPPRPTKLIPGFDSSCLRRPY
jgi:hypothetical protein